MIYIFFRYEVEIYLPHSENPEQQIQQNKSNGNTAAKQIRSTIMKIEYLCYYTPKITEFSKYKIIPKK